MPKAVTACYLLLFGCLAISGDPTLAQSQPAPTAEAICADFRRILDDPSYRAAVQVQYGQPRSILIDPRFRREVAKCRATVWAKPARPYPDVTAAQKPVSEQKPVGSDQDQISYEAAHRDEIDRKSEEEADRKLKSLLAEDAAKQGADRRNSASAQVSDDGKRRVQAESNSPASAQALAVNAGGEQSQADQDQSALVGKIVKDYRADRLTGKEYSVSFNERCLRDVLLADYPDYKFSEDVKAYSPGLNPTAPNLVFNKDPQSCRVRYADIDMTAIKLAAKAIAEAEKSEWETNRHASDSARLLQEQDLRIKGDVEFPVTSATEAGSEPFTCRREEVKAPEYNIGKIPTLPDSGAEVVASAASQVTLDDTDDSTLTRIFKRATEAASSKAEFEAALVNARSEFFLSTPGSDERVRAEKLFGDLLFEKDIFLVSAFIEEGVTRQAQDRADAVAMFTGGDLDHGVRWEAHDAFESWVNALRTGMHAPPQGQLWIPTPDQYVQGLKSAMGSYAVYKQVRDRAEYKRWQDDHGGGPAEASGFGEVLNRYFEEIYDKRLTDKFCSASQDVRAQMITDRQKLRAAFIAAEAVQIDPETVGAVEVSKSSEQRKAMYQVALSDRQAEFGSDPKMLAIHAWQDSLADLSGRHISPPSIEVLEADARLDIGAHVTARIKDLLAGVGVPMPALFAVREDLRRGTYSAR